ncbi:MAG TPA: class I SAM-dependent methyltransferase [Thermoplasmata archaeon]|nr:class I SAM-dependent methyltransferase [Thermoplasmata archaeon]
MARGQMPDEVLALETGGETVRLRYVSEPPELYLLATDPDARWPADVLRTGRATIRWGEVRAEGSARLVIDREVRERILVRFRAAAGPDRADRWYGRAGAMIAVRVGSKGDSGLQFDRWIRDEFDSSAAGYAGRLERNPVEWLWRRRSVEILERTFPRPGRLLEIGSGPGFETIPMLRMGHRVVAIDVSRGMLEQLEANARGAEVQGSLETRQRSGHDLGQLVDELGARSFDGAYSTFGALNLEPDLGPVVAGLARLVRLGGLVVAGAFNRRAILEPAVAIASGHAARLAGRRRSPAPVGSHRFSTDVYLRSVTELQRAFRPEFGLQRVDGVGMVLPPPNVADRLDRLGVRWDRLDEWDRRIGRNRTFAGLSDHFFATFERSATD